MSARVFDRNGWFEIAKNPLSKAGVFPFRGSSIGAPDAEKLYNVFLPPDELGAPETVNSARLAPLIIGHAMLGDPDLLNENVIPAEQKGVHGVVGDRVFYDADTRVLFGNIKIFSATAPRTINGGIDDISLGYRCEYVPTSGVDPVSGLSYEYVQRNMRFNHGAIVKDGRRGSEISVMDGAENGNRVFISFDAKDVVKMESLKKRNLTGHTAIVNVAVAAYAKRAFKGRNVPSKFGCDAADEEAVSSDPSLSDIADVLKDVLPQIAEINDAISNAGAGGADPDDMEPDMEPEIGADGAPSMDEATGKPKMKQKIGEDGKPVFKKKEVKELPATGTDAAEIERLIEKAVAPVRARLESVAIGGAKNVLAEISKRDALATKLAGFTGGFDASDMTAQDVAAYGVKKLGIPAQSGHEITAVEAWLHNRQPAGRAFAGNGQDAAPVNSKSVDAFLAGKI